MVDRVLVLGNSGSRERLEGPVFRWLRGRSGAGSSAQPAQEQGAEQRGDSGKAVQQPHPGSPGSKRATPNDLTRRGQRRKPETRTAWYTESVHLSSRYRPCRLRRKRSSSGFAPTPTTTPSASSSPTGSTRRATHAGGS